MRILYYNEAFLSRDGSRRHAENLYRALEKLPDVEVLPWPRPLDTDSDAGTRRAVGGTGVGVQIARFIKRAVDSVITTVVLARRRKTFDLVLARLAVYDWTPLLLARFFHRDYILESNSPYYYECGVLRHAKLIGWIRWWERVMLKNAKLIYTVSDMTARMQSREYGIPLDRFVTIPNGYKTTPALGAYADAGEQLAAAKREMNLSDKFVVTFVGSLQSWHGIEMLQQLARHYEETPAMQFLVIGDGPNRNLLTERPNLTLLGALPYERMQRFLMASDVGVMPYKPISDFYFSPLKLYDMIGACLPSVGPSVGQIEEVIEAAPEVGFLIDGYEMSAYVRLLDRLLSRPALLDEKRAALWRIRERYSWDYRAKQLIEAVNRLTHV